MADIRLDRTYRQRPGAPLAQNFANCGRLDWVAGACSRPMRLDEGDRIWIKAVLHIGPFKEGGLMRLRGEGGDAGRAAVGIAVRTGNHRMDAIRASASGEARAGTRTTPPSALALHSHRLAENARQRPVGDSIVAREEADEAEGTGQDVHAADNRRVTPAGLDRRDRRIQCDERRGARRIDREARSMEVENVGNPI